MNRLYAFAVLCCLSIFAHAEENFSPNYPENPLNPASEVLDGSARGGLVGVPIPFSDPAIGTGLAVMVGYLYPLDKNDHETPESYTAIGGFWSDNGSKGSALIQRLYLQQDKYRLSFGGGSAEIETDFYGIGNEAGEQDRSVPLSQEGEVYFAEASVRTWQGIYLGLGVGYAELDTKTKFPLTQLPGGPIEINQTSRLMSYSISAVGDWRNDVYTPTAGALLEVEASFRERDGLIDGQYRKYSAAYNYYLALSKQETLALRASTCYAQGDVPFYDLCLFGKNQDLRGYAVGRFRDRAQLTLQGEYRRQLSRRWGAVVFAGVGNIDASFGDFSAAKRLTTYGLGLRFRVSKDPRINLRVDYAHGEAEETLHISIGEAF